MIRGPAFVTQAVSLRRRDSTGTEPGAVATAYRLGDVGRPVARDPVATAPGSVPSFRTTPGIRHCHPHRAAEIRSLAKLGSQTPGQPG